MLKVINPATEKQIAEIPSDTAETVKAKFKKAREAQAIWSKSPASERNRVISRFADLIIERIDELAQVMTSETGKPLAHSKNELRGTPGRVRFFIDNWESTVSPEEVTAASGPGSTAERISWEPLGVVINISAWNYPWFVGTNVYVPAILTGSSVLYKPSEFSSLTGLKMAELLKEAGLPDGVFQTVIGGGDVGAELLALPAGGVFFTGSHATGVRIAETVASRFMRVQLELGGKDPVYVREDADARAAAESLADGAFYNNGQSCCSVERIYVHESLHDEFVKHFLETLKGFKIGDPMDEKTYLGPLTRKPQIDVLRDQIKDALDKGAKLECGGEPISGTGWYFQPTVFTQVSHAMKLMRDESFGPIIGIQKVSSDAEAIERMNDTEYGLTAGVFTKDRGKAESLMAKLDSGSVYWNCCDRVSAPLPWTGRKHSGIGSTLSRVGIRALVQPKAWHLRQT